MNKSTVVSENRTETQNYIDLNYASAVNLKQLPLEIILTDCGRSLFVSDLSCQSLVFVMEKKI